MRVGRVVEVGVLPCLAKTPVQAASTRILDGGLGRPRRRCSLVALQPGFAWWLRSGLQPPMTDGVVDAPKHRFRPLHMTLLESRAQSHTK